MSDAPLIRRVSFWVEARPQPGPPGSRHSGGTLGSTQHHAVWQFQRRPGELHARAGAGDRPFWTAAVWLSDPGKHTRPWPPHSLTSSVFLRDLGTDVAEAPGARDGTEGVQVTPGSQRVAGAI